MSSPTFTPIPASALGGAIAVNVFSSLATLALVSVFLRIFWVALRWRWRSSAVEPQEYVFFSTQLGQYAACLILAMMFNALAGMLGMTWLVRGGISDDGLCRTQAILMAIGNIAGGFFTIAIAVHTFGSLVLQLRQSAIICRSTITVGWALSLALATSPLAIHHSEGSVYGPDGLLCDIRSIFPKEQFFFHLLPILLFSILAAILYSLIFLVLRGTLKIKGGMKLTLNPDVRWKNSQGVGENYHRFVARVARSMLWYPVAYIALLVPYSLLRLFAISGFNVPFSAMIFAFVCWYLLPVVDVLLLYNTFRVLSPAFDGVSTMATSRKSRDVESMPGPPYLEKLTPIHASQRRMALEHKIDLYRSEGPSPAFKLHDRKESQDSLGSSSSKRSLLTKAPDYDYVVATLPPPAMSPPGREPIRPYSPFASTALTVPPRRASPVSNTTLSPKLSPTRQTIPQSISEEQLGLDMRPMIPRQSSSSTFGRPAPNSRATSWISEWNPEGPMTENITRQQLSPRSQTQALRPMVSVPMNSNGGYYTTLRSLPPSSTGSVSRYASSKAPTLASSTPTSPPQGVRPLTLVPKQKRVPSTRKRKDTDSIDTSSFYSTR